MQKFIQVSFEQLAHFFYNFIQPSSLSMSIYSGFATRQQEHKYNSLLETLIIALKKRIIKFYNREEADEDKFKLLLKKVYKKMYILEKGKFMTPKYTSCLSDLVQQLSIEINYDTMSQCSSVASNLTFRKSGENEELQSRNALKLKFNELERKQTERRQSSALSIPRRNKYVRSSAQNEEQEERKMNKIANSMYQTVEERVGQKKRFKGALVGLKELRGTSHMPKWEDFAPKRSQIFPVSPRRSPRNVIKSHNITKEDSQYIVFRRQKYVKPDLKVQDL